MSAHTPRDMELMRRAVVRKAKSIRTVVKFTATVLAAALMAPAAHAYDYTFVEARFVNISPDGPDGPGDNADDLDGVQLAGSAAIHPKFHLFGSFAELDDLTLLSAGVAYNHSMPAGFELTGGVSVDSADIDNGGDDTALGLRADLRWAIPGTPFEVVPGLRYTQLFDDSDLAVRGGFLYTIIPNLRAVASYSVGSDADRLTAGARYEFGL